jgi:glycosyltransferase involved in cell wall biosynthesis
MISLVLPTYNEAKIIEKNINRIDEAMLEYFGKDFEIIIVEESTDETASVIKKLMKKNTRIRHIHSDKRLGKGGAIEKGIHVARSDQIIFMDMDLATDLADLPRLMKTLEKNDIVVGSRYLAGSAAHRTIFRLIMSKSYNFLVKLLLGLPYQDLQCGFKAFRKSRVTDIINKIKNKSYFWDTEFIYYAHKNKLKIKEIPVKWHEVNRKAPAVGNMLVALLKLRFVTVD